MTDTPKIMPVTRCGAVGRCMAHPSSYKSTMETQGWRYRTPQPADIAKYALDALERARAADIATHEANAEALATNTKVRETVTALMNSIGMPASYSETDRHSRARYPKSIRHDAGYLGDLQRNVPIDDGFASASVTYERLKAEYQKYAESAERLKADADRAAAAADEARKAERRKNLALAAILLRYELDPDSEWGDILEALRKRDQRLDLAVAMQQTRGDWSDGAYRVKAALDRFTIQNDEDKAIAADVVECLIDFEDGRVFRDTTWSYGRLFAEAADQQLAADIQLAAESVER